MQGNKRHCGVPIPLLFCLSGMLILCAALALYVLGEGRAFRSKEVWLDQQVRLGMQREEVYQKLKYIGDYKIYKQPMGSCDDFYHTGLDSEEAVISHPFFLLGVIARYMCFDGNGRLIKYYRGYE
jgi:hypothetical protein